MAKAIASSTPSSSKPPKVFLNFRGRDTRSTFTSHLESALRKKGSYEVFKDDIGLPKGEDIGPELIKAIEDSKNAIVVFSESYASSTWCLKELVKIMDCRKERRLTVLPVFFHVDPTDLRKPTDQNSIGKALNEHKKHQPIDMVASWEKAVVELGGIAGFHVTRHTIESTVIGEIVREVSKILEPLLSSIVIKENVGIESRIKNFEAYLKRELEDVRVVGIWGMGGIGKTTLAEEVFEKIRHSFDVSGIVRIGKKYRNHGSRSQHSMILLQKHLFEHVLKCKEDIQTVDLGASKIKQRLSSKKVLIILDDVDKPAQIEALVGKPGEQHDWFGSKSRIIVTTRNRELLKEYGDNYDNIYKVEQLSEDEGLQFFCQKAFKSGHPPNDVYKELSLKFVKYGCGLPLALSILSNLLCSKSEEQWKKQLEHLMKNPDEEISNVLRLSYDALSMTNKQIFLEIARRFHGESKSHVTKELERRHFNPAIGIPALVDRSLITAEGGKILVHDLIIQMALHINREEKKAGKHSLEDENKIPPQTYLQLPLPQTKQCESKNRQPLPKNLGTISGENIKGLIDDGKLFQIPFPSYRIPEWFLHWTLESSLKIELSLDDPVCKRRRKGFALFLLFEIKEHDKADKFWELNSISCHFYIDEQQVENFLVFADFKDFRVGSNAVCCYVPLEWFEKQFNASHILHTSISVKGMDILLRIFGIHEVFEQGMEDFINKLARSANDHLEELDFRLHCKKLLDGEGQIYETSGNIMGFDHEQREGANSLRVPQNEIGHASTFWDYIRSIKDKYLLFSKRKKRHETYLKLETLFQGSFARRNYFMFAFPFPVLSPWFFHHGIGNVAVCYIPLNIYDDERWLGLQLYVQCKQCHPVDDSASRVDYVDVHCRLYAHGIWWFPLFTLQIKINTDNFVAFHVPRENFSKTLNSCKGISAFFVPTASDVQVKMCGTRLLYEQDSKLICKGIMECIFRKSDLLSYVHDSATGLLERNTEVDQEIKLIHEPGEAITLKFPQKLLTSTEQVAKEVSTSLHNHRKEYAERRAVNDSDPVLFHHKHSFLENWGHINEDTLTSLSATNFNHLHIMAETLIYDQIGTFEFLVGEFFKHRVLVTLSLEGDIVFVLRHFHPSSPYNLCFPCEGISNWFVHQQSESKVAIELPRNLSKDKRWRGLVICAAFSVNEHPGTFPKASFKLLCHLSSAGQCLNSAALYSISSKDQIKWLLYRRKFIWLTYIPRGTLTELNGKHSLEARIYNPCPELIVDKCGIRLLYKKDVEGLRKLIFQYCTLVVQDSYDYCQRPGSRSPRRSRTEAEDENWLMKGRYMIDLFYLNVFFFVKKVVTG